MTDLKGYYRTLGVAQTATYKEIKIAYRVLALQYHSDRIRDPVSKLYSYEKMIKINEAYEVLSDPIKRKEYDQSSNDVKRESHYYSYPPQNNMKSKTSNLIGNIITLILFFLPVILTIGHFAAPYLSNYFHYDDQTAVLFQPKNNNITETNSFPLQKSITLEQISTNNTNTDNQLKYEFVKSIGKEQQIRNIQGIAVDKNGTIYISDSDKDRILKFNSNGQFIKAFGSSGNRSGEFSFPGDIVIDSSGLVYVSDAGNNRIQKFNSNGQFMMVFDNSQFAQGFLPSIGGFVVNSAGDLFVLDKSNHYIVKFKSNGVVSLAFGYPHSAQKDFFIPERIAIDSSDNIYVLRNDYAIQKFNSQGQFLSWTGSSDYWRNQNSLIDSISIDSEDYLYFTDYFNHRIYQFNLSGQFITAFGTNGDNINIEGPYSIQIDSNGKIYTNEKFFEFGTTTNSSETVKSFDQLLIFQPID
jgi:curved DNA-binding protein CbpA